MLCRLLLCSTSKSSKHQSEATSTLQTVALNGKRRPHPVLSKSIIETANLPRRKSRASSSSMHEILPGRQQTVHQPDVEANDPHLFSTFSPQRSLIGWKDDLDVSNVLSTGYTVGEIPVQRWNSDGGTRLQPEAPVKEPFQSLSPVSYRIGQPGNRSGSWSPYPDNLRRQAASSDNDTDIGTKALRTDRRMSPAKINLDPEQVLRWRDSVTNSTRSSTTKDMKIVVDPGAEEEPSSGQLLADDHTSKPEVEFKVDDKIERTDADPAVEIAKLSNNQDTTKELGSKDNAVYPQADGNKTEFADSPNQIESDIDYCHSEDIDEDNISITTSVLDNIDRQHCCLHIEKFPIPGAWNGSMN